MGDMNLKEVVVFLDDLIVFSKTLEDHEARLTKVLNRLKEYGLKLSPEKCRFFQSSVRDLGHVVSERGLETDPRKDCSLHRGLLHRVAKRLLRDFSTISDCPALPHSPPLETSAVASIENRIKN